VRTGLIAGKFWPPHFGHHFAINTLQGRCERAVVLVCATATQNPGGRARALWIQAAHPGAEVVVVDDFCAEHHPDACRPACSLRWAERVGQLGLGKIDIVASSERYGSAFAECLGAMHVAVDPERTQFPLSSSAVRADLSARWNDLHLATRMGLVRRLVILGAESTGTSTLASSVSVELGVPLAAEAGRTVSWELFAAAGSMEDLEWDAGVFWSIVGSQIALESQALGAAASSVPGRHGPWIVCDTDTLATVAWWERYLGSDSRQLEAFSRARLGDLYLLTDPKGVQFDDSDPLRDGRSIRLRMHERFMELLESSGRPWRLVTGSPTERLEQAMDAISVHEQVEPRWVHH